MKKLIAGIFASAMLLSGLAFGTGTASAAAPCVGTWSVGVGGLNDNTSQTFEGRVNQRVGYNSYDTQGGVNELNRLVRQHRSQCPGDHIKMLGHSGGAAVVHVWVSQNGNIGKVSAVLLADPKRAAGPGAQGFAGTDWPFNTIRPLAGTDANFRGVPVLTVCHNNDHICNSADPFTGGYATGAHGRYEFNANAYANNANGVLYLPNA